MLGHRFLGCHFMSRRSSFSRSLFFFFPVRTLILVLTSSSRGRAGQLYQFIAKKICFKIIVTFL